MAGRHADPDPRHLRRSLAGAAMRAAFALGLIIGLTLALARITPSFLDAPPPDVVAAPPAPPDEPSPSPSPSSPSSTDEDDAAPPGPSPSPSPIEAPPPSETSVQVLDATGAGGAIDEAVDALTELGYDVVATNPASGSFANTTTFFTAGHEAEARALVQRDPRFGVVQPNTSLSESVDVHVVLGDDWPA